jgi:HEAT repeat protein
LNANLAERDVRLRIAAASGLVRFGPDARPALPELIKAVMSTDPELRLAAAEAILAIDRKPRLKDL